MHMTLMKKMKVGLPAIIIIIGVQSLILYCALNHSADSSVGEREHGEEPLIQDSKMNDRLGLDISEEEKNSACEERLRTEITNCGTISTVRHNTEDTAGSHVGHCTPSREDKEIQQRASQSTKTRESQIRAG